MHATQALPLVRALWQDLLRGALKIIATPDPAGYELVLGPSRPQLPCFNHARRDACLRNVLRGEAQKRIGLELGVSPATVAGMLRTALSDMGLDVPSSRIPIALPLLAHAAEGETVVAHCDVAGPSGAEPVWRLRLSEPDEALSSRLSPSEREVVARYIRGQTHAEIALVRRSSPRTIANQLALSFKKLRASGRFELIRVLVEQSFRAGRPIRLSLRASGERQRLIA